MLWWLRGRVLAHERLIFSVKLFSTYSASAPFSLLATLCLDVGLSSFLLKSTASVLSSLLPLESEAKLWKANNGTISTSILSVCLLETCGE